MKIVNKRIVMIEIERIRIGYLMNFSATHRVQFEWFTCFIISLCLFFSTLTSYVSSYLLVLSTLMGCLGLVLMLCNDTLKSSLSDASCKAALISDCVSAGVSSPNCPCNVYGKCPSSIYYLSVVC